MEPFNLATSSTGDDGDEMPPQRQCIMYHPGHNVHWIQVRLAFESSWNFWRGRVVGIGPEIVDIQCDEGLRRFRNHQTERIDAAVLRYGSEIGIHDRYKLARIGQMLFYLAPDEGTALRPCRADSYAEFAGSRRRDER